MEKVRVELHMTKAEVKLLDMIAKQEGRSRKNYCETEIRKIIRTLSEQNQKQIKSKI